MKTLTTDVLVIGGGAGGLSVAAGAVQMGARVVLLEGHKMGGDCLNYGCVPSKALLAAGAAAYAQTIGAGMGVSPVIAKSDYAKAKDFVGSVIAEIKPHDSVDRFEALGVQVIQEFGRFISPTAVQVADTVITARRIVIATGSRPFVPAVPGLEDVPYYTNENIFDLREKPDHLLVLGGGPIGMEMAQAHRRLGCAVTVIEGKKAFGKEDPEMAAIVLQKLRGEGITIVEAACAQNISCAVGEITVGTSNGTFRGTHLLVAAGRQVNIEKLNLEAAGIEHHPGGIKVDAGLRSSNRRVYAIGDVAGDLKFTHVAGYHAGVIIRSMLFGLPAKAKADHIPWATYTDPELAQVGMNEAQARAKFGSRLDVVRFNFSGSDRAIATSKTDGLIKVMIVKGRPIGASIVGAGAGELIGLWSMAIANNLKMSAIAATVLPYPSMGEINKRAAGAYFSPKLFESRIIKRLVAFVQRYFP
jgi:pyruvate/2-oxoglutarate dehydrogenase complex dihydrolipoamide dehydrogenase (E3) component